MATHDPTRVSPDPDPAGGPERAPTVWVHARADATTRPAPPPVSEKPPERIGPYRLLELLGGGGMGLVYRARDESLDRDVALKVLRPSQDAREREIDLARFEREGKVAAALDHPGIVRVHATGVDGERSYIVQELVEGPNLARHLDGKPLPSGRAAELALALAQAVAHAHARGVLHRDLKPSNVLVDSQGRVRITDFGLARRATDGTLTKSGEGFGTPSYMAPEQTEGKATERTDVYGLGSILYETLVAAPPFEGNTYPEILSGVLWKRPVPPSVRNPQVEPSLEAICLVALAKRPEERYSSASEMADDLEAFLARRPVRAFDRLGRRPPWRARRFAIGLAGAFAVLAGVASLIVHLRGGGDSNGSSPEPGAPVEEPRGHAGAQSPAPPGSFDATPALEYSEEPDAFDPILGTSAGARTFQSGVLEYLATRQDRRTREQIREEIRLAKTREESLRLLAELEAMEPQDIAESKWRAGLAHSWFAENVEGGSRIRVRLRTSARWSRVTFAGGATLPAEPIDAGDVVFTWKVLRAIHDPANLPALRNLVESAIAQDAPGQVQKAFRAFANAFLSRTSELHDVLSGIESVERTGDDTIEWSVSAPADLALDTILAAVPIAAEHFYTTGPDGLPLRASEDPGSIEFLDDYVRHGATSWRLCGTGPYRIESYDPESGLVVKVANEDDPFGRATSERIELRRKGHGGGG